MAYDVQLADRIRELLADGSPVTEQPMFGGLAFLVGGKLAVAASGKGGLLVRADPVRADELVATTTARPMEMKGRVVCGWLYVDGDSLRTKRQLSHWVAVGTAAAKDARASGRKR
ncbi:TfoX/Sxy family protein [Fodinicola acaciae]|uniref:TfoX/Sxy family protein n=1 Tax=Fodinicola acaciae TaxID=2681555 RepID=UPI0013D272D8|nr:TfoX/Sxy family protein [Fodinicola acaciae]